jgi:hypothetical protein
VTISRGFLGSASIFFRNLPTSTSMLRSNGSKRRLVKASSKVSRLTTRPGLVTNILRRANSPRVRGIASPDSRASAYASTLRTRPANARARSLSARARRRRIPERRASALVLQNARSSYATHRRLQVVYRPNISSSRHGYIVVGSSVSNTRRLAKRRCKCSANSSHWLGCASAPLLRVLLLMQRLAPRAHC